MKKIVYTAIFGGKDNLKKIDKSDNIDYVVFTDDPNLISNDFKVVLCSKKYEDPVRNARYYKILSHKVLPEYDYSLWIDATISIKDIDVNQLFDNYLENNDIAIHRHPRRNCIYKEAEVCIRINKDEPSVIRKQMEKYMSLDYPINNGLVASNILFRKHTSKIAEFNEAWWNEINNHSRRDQLSFNYVMHNLKFGYRELNGYVQSKDVDGFSIAKHKLPDNINWVRKSQNIGLLYNKLHKQIKRCKNVLKGILRNSSN